MSTSSKGDEGVCGTERAASRGIRPSGDRIARGVRSRRAPHRRPEGRRGFTLVEALVALVVAGLLLPSLARALGGAWAAAHTPMDVVSAMTLARDVAEGAAVPPDARRLGFTAERTSAAATVLVLPSGVAPAPRGTGKGDQADDLKPEATPSAIRLAVPKGFDAPPGGDAPPAVSLRRVSVVVRTPSGRRVTLDGLRLDDAAR